MPSSTHGHPSLAGARLLLGLLASCALGAAVSSAQTSALERYDYDGDRARMIRSPEGESVYILEGNARFWGQDVEITGDLGRMYAQAERMEVVGSVEVTSDSLDLWCDSLIVYEAREEGLAFGQVRIETADGAMGRGRRGRYLRQEDWLALAGDARVIDEDFVVAGDSIQIDRRRGEMEALGNVSIVDEVNRSVVRGEHATFDRQRGIAVVDSLPELRSRRGSGPMTVVRSEWMSFDRQGETSTAVGDVRFRQGATEAHADTARFLGEDLLVLSGSPSVQQHGRVMTGQLIRVRYVDSRLHAIDVTGQASLVDSTPDTLASEWSSIPLANTLTGDSLHIDFEDGDIQRTYVEGQAHSVYIPEDQEDVVSVNDVRGQSIDIGFVDGRVGRVTVRGSVSGAYRFVDRVRLEADSTAVDTVGAAIDTLAAAVDTLVAAGDSLGVAEDGVAAPADSLLAPADGRALPADSLGVAGADSLPAARRATGLHDFASLADEVTYEGQRTEFWVPEGRIRVSEKAVVKNRSLELYAEDVHFDTDARELLAEGDPRLIDKESELVGDRMGYLFDPQTGAVADGATRFDDGFYYGRHIRRVDGETLLVREGTYTTCDLAEPHYHFQAKKMKLKIGERVVARQVALYVSDIPLAVLPFYYKSLDSGRHSGILFPNINLGVSSRDGRYVRGLGYYWATNEYTDFQFLLDYNERQDARFTLKNVYNFRYGASGNVDAWYYRRFSETQQGDEWKIKARHSQPELFDVWRASAQLELSSKNLTRGDRSGNAQNDLIESRLYSTASLSRSFDNGASLNLSGTRTQFPNAEDDDLLTDNRISESNVPISLSFKSRPLWSDRPREDDPWFASILHDIQFSQSYNSRYGRRIGENSTENEIDLSGRFGLSYAPANRIGPFNWTTSSSFSEAWNFRDVEETVYREEEVAVDDSTTTTVVVVDEERSQDLSETESRPSLSFSNRLSTDLYGIFDTHLGPIRAMKHKISFSTSHNYRPQLGDKQEQSQSFSFSLGNELSLKVLESQDPEEGEAGETSGVRGGRGQGQGDPGRGREGEAGPDEPKYRKLNQLLSWNLDTSVDPDADPGRKWSDIRSTVRIRPGITQAISFSMNQTIDPYTFEFKSTRFNSDLRLRGSLNLLGSLTERTQPKNKVLERLPASADTTGAAADSLENRYGEQDFYDPWGEEIGGDWLETGDRNAIPWDLYLRGSVTQSRNLATDVTTTRANLSGRANLSLPGSWKLSYSADFDIETGEFTNQFWTLTRPLHQWELRFSRGLADGQDFGFSLYLKDIQDLRIDRGDRARSGDLRSRVSSF